MIKDNSRNMKRLAYVLSLILVGATALGGCRHVQVNVERTTPDLKATETAIAYGVAATLTAQVPSLTITSAATDTQGARQPAAVALAVARTPALRVGFPPRQAAYCGQ